MVMCVPANCSGVWSQCRRFGSVQSLNKKILPCSLPGGHVRSSKLLGCVVTMQEVLNRAKFEFGFVSVLLQPGCHVRPASCLGVWSQCRRFGSEQSLSWDFPVLIQPGCHVRPANCLGVRSQCRRFGIVQSLT